MSFVLSDGFSDVRAADLERARRSQGYCVSPTNGFIATRNAVAQASPLYCVQNLTHTPPKRSKLQRTVGNTINSGVSTTSEHELLQVSTSYSRDGEDFRSRS